MIEEKPFLIKAFLDENNKNLTTVLCNKDLGHILEYIPKIEGVYACTQYDCFLEIMHEEGIKYLESKIEILFDAGYVPSYL